MQASGTRPRPAGDPGTDNSAEDPCKSAKIARSARSWYFRRFAASDSLRALPYPPGGGIIFAFQEGSGDLDSVQDGPAHLVERIMAGDRDAERALVERYMRGVRIVLAKSRDPALVDDLAQDTLLLTLMKIRQGQINEPQKLPGYIVSIANNLLIEYYRKNKRRNTESDLEMIGRVAADSRGPYAETERQDLMDALKHAIGELSQERDRVLLREYFFKGIEKQQLCKQLDVEPEHFDRLKYRALQRLKQIVPGRGGH